MQIDMDSCRQIVMDYVWQQMIENDEVTPPFLQNEKSAFIASRRVSIQYSDSVSSHGQLVPSNDGFTMVVRQGLSEVRRRGVIAHELGHTFLFDIRENPPVPMYSNSDDPQWNIVEGPSYELGRQILLPEYWLRRDAIEPSIQNLFSLRSRFGASSYLIARRLVHDLGLWDACILIRAAKRDYFSQGSKFRGNSFKRLNLSRSDRDLSPAIREASEKTGDIVKCRLRVDGKLFNVEANQSKSGSIVCMIKSFC
jgi:hypothetical protein